MAIVATTQGGDQSHSSILNKGYSFWVWIILVSHGLGSRSREEITPNNFNFLRTILSELWFGFG